MPFNFQLKRALVTGAGKGIGRAIALRLANMGAKVHAISRTESDLESLRKECADINVYNIDITDWAETREAVKKIGPIDFLVNNAGLFRQSPFLEVTKEHLDTEFDINFKAAFNISQVVAKGMVKAGQGGSIVNISGIGALRVFDNASVLGASKAARDMLTRYMAGELGPHNIRVNSINPGLVLTTTTLTATYGSDEIQQYIVSKTPLKKLAEPNDVVNATVFLLSDQAAMINGIVMPLDGGFIL